MKITEREWQHLVVYANVGWGEDACRWFPMSRAVIRSLKARGLLAPNPLAPRSDDTGQTTPAGRLAMLAHRVPREKV